MVAFIFSIRAWSILPSMKKFLQGLGYAFAGLGIAWKEEANFRIQVVMTLLVVAFGWYVRLTSVEWMFVALSIAFVLSAEAFNTAIEELGDLHETNHNPRVARLKDLSAAAVLLASLGALAVGLIVFLPHL